MRFYEAFLAWRAANQWDNEMADHLPELFTAAGLTEIARLPERRGRRPRQPGRGGLGARHRRALVRQIVAAGFLTEDERLQAADAYREYLDGSLERQTLSMATVTGVRPRF